VQNAVVQLVRERLCEKYLALKNWNAGILMRVEQALERSQKAQCSAQESQPASIGKVLF